MGGGFLQLAAYGAQDVYLTGNPQMTFFVAVYKRHTNFAIENVRQYFTGETDFGKKSYCQVERVGDLMNEVYLVVDLPKLSDINKEFDTELRWVNSIGHALIKFIEIEIGGVIVDRHYGLWLEIWFELTVPKSKHRGYEKMIGKTPGQCYFANTEETKIYVPLQFWFCKNRGLSLPLIALQNHEVRFNLTLRNLNELIVSKNNIDIDKQLNEIAIEKRHRSKKNNNNDKCLDINLKFSLFIH